MQSCGCPDIKGELVHVYTVFSNGHLYQRFNHTLTGKLRAVNIMFVYISIGTPLKELKDSYTYISKYMNQCGAFIAK